MHCLAAADALVLPAETNPNPNPNPNPNQVLPVENGEKPSSFALMAATLSRGSVIPSIEDLSARVARIRGGAAGESHFGDGALGDAFVQNLMLPRGSFVADEEEGAYVLQKLPLPGDPL